MPLEIQNLSVVLGGVRAVEDVSFSVTPGEILGLIGPNGAGKTSTINAISGYTKPAKGTVLIDDKNVTRWSPDKLVGAGLARTFQGARLFGALTAFENVLVSALAKERRHQAERTTSELLERLGLAALGAYEARDLPAGDQRLLGLARALATNPKYLLLDEPAAGLNDAESEELSDALRRLSTEEGIGIVVIEHDMGLIMGLCNRIHVLESGKTLFTGSPDGAKQDSAVIEAYLGSAA